MPYSWRDCPDDVRAQMHELVGTARTAFPGNIANVTLRGSLAMGCWNPTTSDVDVLIVTERTPPNSDPREFARSVLDRSGHPARFELSVVRAGDLKPFQYPTPYDFHFGEWLRPRYREQLASRHQDRLREQHVHIKRNHLPLPDGQISPITTTRHSAN